MCALSDHSDLDSGLWRCCGSQARSIIHRAWNSLNERAYHATRNTMLGLTLRGRKADAGVERNGGHASFWKMRRCLAIALSPCNVVFHVPEC